MPEPFPVDPHTLPGNAHTDAAMANVIRLFLLSGALGGLGRAAVGVRDFWGRNTGEPRHAPPRHSTIPLPYPVPEQKLGSDGLAPAVSHAPEPGTDLRNDNEPKAGPPAAVLNGPGDPNAPNLADKAARALELLKQAGEPEPGLVGQTARWLTEHLGMMGPHHNPLEMIIPQNVRSPWDMPWMWPATAAAVGGGAALGWKGTDKLLHAAKDQEEESELAAAKRRFEHALLAQAPMKYGSYQGLDDLAEQAEKRAWDVGHNLLGLYLLTMLGSGAFAGNVAYKALSNSAPDKAVEEALKRRRMMLHQAAPRPFVARPVPVPVEERDEVGGLA